MAHKTKKKLTIILKTNIKPKNSNETNGDIKVNSTMKSTGISIAILLIITITRVNNFKKEKIKTISNKTIFKS